MWWPFGRKGESEFSWYSTAEEVTHVITGTGLTAIVTGSSSGIGAETARVLALRGVHIVMGVNILDEGIQVKHQILKQIPNAKVDVMELDLSSMSSVRKFATEFKSSGHPLNILINNAGIFGAPFTLSEDNIELHFAVNYLGHFLLTHLLIDKMRATVDESGREGRIVNISSMGHHRGYSEGIRFDEINNPLGYSSWCAYSQSKLAVILHAAELTKRLQDEGIEITVNSLHPGVVGTNIHSNVGWFKGWIKVIIAKLTTYILSFLTITRLMVKSIPQGAATTCYLALHPGVKGISGKYFVDCKLEKPSSLAQDPTLAKKLWQFSMNLVGE